jgi:peptide/nickel transport system substrate-binding protein
MRKILLFTLALGLFSCSRGGEMSLAEIEAMNQEGLTELLAKTVSKPWHGEAFVPGRPGGVWRSSVTADPKSFNLLVAERDAETAGIVGPMHDALLDYDVVRREWKPRAAAPEIVVDEAAGTLRVVFTLRDDLYWSYYNSERMVPVTSDDVIFWYNEIEGDPAFQSSAYSGHFLMMEDGSEAEVTIEKIDDKRFSFNFPRIVADPCLTVNRDFGPRHIYEKAKREGGVEGVLDLFNVSSDPKTIPSMGAWFLVEYVPGQRLVYRRNPNHWEKDDSGQGFPYYEENTVRILDSNTEYLVFMNGELEAYSLRPEDLDEVIAKQNSLDYTVFNAEGSISASLWSFNQNPKNADSPQYRWFTQKPFRQAMSCLLNRERISAQVFRGLAEPKLDFFPEPNPYYNPDITLDYTYDPERAEALLASIGIKRGLFGGPMKDSEGREIEFDLSIPSDNNVSSDIASIVMDECSKVGIKVNIRVLDFQKLVEQLTSTYDWQSLMIGLGSNFFPTQGSNVWPSDGNLHLWHPLQKEPATEWEARIDYLYNEGSYTIDKVKAKEIWDEYQRIILEECPVIYLMRRRSFFALRNRWDFANVYYDNLNGAETARIFLKQ